MRPVRHTTDQTKFCALDDETRNTNLWQQTYRRLTVTSVTAESGANGLNAMRNRTNTNEN